MLATTLLGLIVTVGGSFSRWADVPEAISAALTCKAPTQTPTKGDSGNESGTQGLGEQHLSADGTPYLLVQGTPLAPDVAPIHPFLEPHEEGEDGDPGSLAGLTGQVVRSYEAWEGMDFSAEVAVESRAPGSEPHRTSSLLEGRVIADGRFDVRATTPVEVEGEPGVLQERWVFDGRQLLADVADQEVANAYSTTFFRFDRAFDTTCWGLLGVYDWLTDPLEFPLYETVAFEEVETEPGRVLARRTLGDPAPFVSSDYLYDTTGKVAHPLRGDCSTRSDECSPRPSTRTSRDRARAGVRRARAGRGPGRTRPARWRSRLSESCERSGWLHPRSYRTPSSLPTAFGRSGSRAPGRRPAGIGPAVA